MTSLPTAASASSTQEYNEAYFFLFLLSIAMSVLFSKVRKQIRAALEQTGQAGECVWCLHRSDPYIIITTLL